MSLADEVSADPPFEGRRDWVSVPLPDGGQMPAYFVQPSRAPYGPVLLAHDIFGMRGFYESLAHRVARAGFAALVPDFFFRQGGGSVRTVEDAVSRRTGLDEYRSLVDLGSTLQWLRNDSSYRGMIGTLGFCMGGTFALDLCARESDLATVSFYGFPIPQASIAMPPPRPMDLVAEMRGPILAFWGEHDSYVGMNQVREFERVGAAAGIDLKVKILSGLGHSYFTSDTAVDGEAEQRARDSWEEALSFLRRHLSART